MGHPPRIPVELPWDSPVVYFITLCVAGRRKVLANEDAWHAFRKSMARLSGWTILAVVQMPDHMHLLASPEDRFAQVGNISGALKRWIRQELGADWNWQPGSFDRLLRSSESAHQKWLYMRENPVRHGLVAAWNDWPFRLGFCDDRSMSREGAATEEMDAKGNIL